MRRVLKWVGYGLAGLLGLVVVAVGIVYLVSNAHINRVYAVPTRAVIAPATPEEIERGKHIAGIRGCTGCHGKNMEGTVMFDLPPVARLAASNLTRGKGGVGSVYRTEDWDRAIRHGVGPDGKPLIFMPSHEFYPLSDRDLGALIAFIESRTPVDNDLPDTYAGPVGRALYLAGQVPLLPAELIDHQAPRPVAPKEGVSAEYGKYLATACMSCHGMNYSGGPIPGAPSDGHPPRNLTPHETGLKNWSAADLARAVRTGVRPAGDSLSTGMPRFTELTDTEVKAIYLFLRTLPPRPFGGR